MATTTSQPPTVRPDELGEALATGQSVAILDVRTPAEFESVHIPGSHNVPLDQLTDHRAALRDGVTAPLVLVCRSGARARQAEALLREADVAPLQVLEGGLAAWEAAGLPVNRGRARWSVERQVRAIAGALVLVGTLGSLLVWQPLIAIAAFVGAGLLSAGLTDTCGMAMLLLRLPYNRGATVDAAKAVAQLCERRVGG